MKFKDFIKTQPSLIQVDEDSYFLEVDLSLSNVTLNENSADDFGKYHELMYTWHSNGGKFLKADPRHDDAHKIKKDIESRIGKDTANQISEKAKRSAGVVADMIKSHGHKHHGAYWTSKPGDIERLTGVSFSSHDNASDVVHHITDDKGNTRHMGVSLKHLTGSAVHAPTSNPGVGEMDKRLGVRTDHHLTLADKRLNKEFPQHASKSQKAKKAESKADKAYYDRSAEIKQRAVSRIADTHVEAFNSMNHNAQVHHLRSLIHAHDTPDVPQIVVTSHSKGTRVENRAKRYHPNNIKKIETSREGWNTIRHKIHFADGSQEEWKHRYKFESSPHSPLKASFERADRND